MRTIVGNKEKIKNDFNKVLFQLEKDTLYEVSIKKYRKLRSLNANSCMWQLVSETAEVINSSKEEVYLEELKKYGQSMLIPVECNCLPIGYFKYYEYMQSGIINGKKCDWYKVFKGSSNYDTKEMSILLNGIVEDCKELEIPTPEDYRIQQLIDDWEKHYARRFDRGINEVDD